jgi:phosphatidylinositol alpha 1,6-mannosyltransferase
MRVALVTESFLPEVNGVTNSCLRVLEHLAERGAEALVVAPGHRPTSHEGLEIVRTPAITTPLCPGFALGLPTMQLEPTLRWFRPDVVHLASLPNVHRWARGVDCDRFDPRHRDAALRRALLGPTDTALVGYVGRIAREKRLERLRAISGLPGVRLVVIGDGPARADLRALLPDAVFTGFLDGHRLATAFASLDVFVHTGDAETFCQSAQDALASGVPVVAPAAGGLTDVVHHGRNGLLWPPSSVVHLRRQVEWLTADAGLRAALAANARRSVLRRTWSVLGDELLRHYQRLVSDDRSRPQRRRVA